MDEKTNDVKKPNERRNNEIKYNQKYIKGYNSMWNNNRRMSDGEGDLCHRGKRTVNKTNACQLNRPESQY